MRVPYPNTYWVIRNQLLAGEHPTELDGQATVARLASLMDTGIRAFLDLTEMREMKNYESLLPALAESRGAEITFQRMPIPDRGIPSVPMLINILDAIDRSVRSRQPVFVHCFAGVGRTGTVVGCYLRRHGWARKGEVVAQISELRKRMPGGKELSPHTPEQVYMVEHWEDGM